MIRKFKLLMAGLMLAVSCVTFLPTTQVEAAPKCGDMTDAQKKEAGIKECCPSTAANPNKGYKNSVAECNMKGNSTTLMKTVQTIINVVLSLTGIISTIMIIIGGIQYATSAGDAQKATKAKSTILYAVIGLVIALLAYAIVNFVLGSVFSS